MELEIWGRGGDRGDKGTRSIGTVSKVGLSSVGKVQGGVVSKSYSKLTRVDVCVILQMSKED